jgi:RNA polymerase sigma factor (sigma-70 family)
MSSAGSDPREELVRLLGLTGRGDQQAFAELYQRTSSKLFGICLRMLGDRGAAEDVLQEIYTTVWRRAASFDAAKAAAMTWLVALSRNKAIDRLRQRREERLDDTSGQSEIADDQPSPTAVADSTQERQRLQACLDALEPQHRSVVSEAFFTGATYNDLAIRRKVPLGTMKSWIRRSLLQLRACLDR